MMISKKARETGSRARRRFGFTLVELLVVIGIIALLISILLPALNSARRSANSTKCLSNLRQLGLAFQMYAGTFKNAFPVSRQDLPELPSGPQNTINTYWHDMLFPFVLRNSQQLSSLSTRNDFDRYRKSMLWCPVWEADHPEVDLSGSYVNRFYTGYGINMWPSCRPDYPTAANQLPPSSQVNGRSASAPGVGRYYKKHEWTQPADRMLVADASLWIVSMVPTNAAGLLSPQRVDYRVQEATWASPPSGPGAMNIDRYRHGKYPGHDGTYFNKGGTMNYNILFVDGHAITSTSVKDAYKAVRMRYP